MNRNFKLLILILLSCVATHTFAATPTYANDSVIIKNTVNSNKNLIHPGTTTSVVELKDENYQNIFPCPPEIYCTDVNNKIFPAFTGKKILTRSCTASPNKYEGATCFDSQGTYSSTQVESQQTLFCPTMCSVSRELTPSGSTGIIATKPAICPKGYAQVGMKDVNQEVKQASSPLTVGPSPAITMIDYQSKYVPNNYTCTPSGTVKSVKLCKTIPEYVAHEFNCDKINAKLNTNTAVGTYSTELGQYLNCTTPYQAAYAMGCYTTNTCTSFTTNCTGSGIYVGWTYTYKYDQCVSPTKELVYSGQTLPTTIICARIGYKWQNK